MCAAEVAAGSKHNICHHVSSISTSKLPHAASDMSHAAADVCTLCLHNPLHRHLLGGHVGAVDIQQGGRLGNKALGTTALLSQPATQGGLASTPVHTTLTRSHLLATKDTLQTGAGIVRCLHHTQNQASTACGTRKLCRHCAAPKQHMRYAVHVGANKQGVRANKVRGRQ